MKAHQSRFLCTLTFLLVCGFAHGAIIQYSASLSGPAEDPPVPSPGTGFALVSYNDVAHTLRVEFSFSDLVGTTTAAHIHAPTALPLAGTIGVAVQPGTFTGFPAGVTSGVYDGTIDLTSTLNYTSGFLTIGGGTAAGAEAALIGFLNEQRAYLNIHSTFRPGGEIRGFLARVPDNSGSAPLFAFAVLVVLGLGRFRSAASA